MLYSSVFHKMALSTTSFASLSTKKPCLLFHTHSTIIITSKRTTLSCLRNQEPAPCNTSTGNVGFGYFLFDVARKGFGFDFGVLNGFAGFRSEGFCSRAVGGKEDVEVKGEVEVGSGHEVASADTKVLSSRTLKLHSGSCYLPHPDKVETGGEDAHFICIDEQAIGVADGVGGWASMGINAGLYAQELMSKSVTAILDEPKGYIDPARVLERAYSCTRARGSSTACIIALADQGLHAINLGDSGFIVIRDGCTVFQSPVQQHGFNFPAQLEYGNNADPPSSGQVFNVPVAPGDVIVAGTDGLFDNLFSNEITAVVVHAVRAGLEPQVVAQSIASVARKRAEDTKQDTPFSTAAQKEGFQYYGGKLDDITVVVSYITSSRCE